MRRPCERHRILHDELILITSTDPERGAGDPSRRSSSWLSGLLQSSSSLAAGASYSRRAPPSPVDPRSLIPCDPLVRAAREVLSGSPRLSQDNAALPGSQVTILDFFEAYSARYAHSMHPRLAQPKPCRSCAPRRTRSMRRSRAARTAAPCRTVWATPFMVSGGLWLCGCLLPALVTGVCIVWGVWASLRIARMPWRALSRRSRLRIESK